MRRVRVKLKEFFGSPSWCKSVLLCVPKMPFEWIGFIFMNFCTYNVMEIHRFPFRLRALELWSQCYYFPPIHKLMFQVADFLHILRHQYLILRFISPIHATIQPILPSQNLAVEWLAFLHRIFEVLVSITDETVDDGDRFFVLSADSQRLILG